MWLKVATPHPPPTLLKLSPLDFSQPNLTVKKTVPQAAFLILATPLRARRLHSMLWKSKVIYDVNKVTQQSEFWTTFTWAIKKWTKRWAEIVLSDPRRENCKCIRKKAIVKKRVKAWRWYKKITRWYKVQLRISVCRHKKGCFSQLIFSHLAASLDIKSKVWKLLKKTFEHDMGIF